MRRFVGMAIHNIVPLPMREDFLQNYTCSPPPIFMIIVSLLEVRLYVCIISVSSLKVRPYVIYRMLQSRP